MVLHHSTCKTGTVIQQCLSQGNAAVTSVCIDMMTPVQVWLHQVQYNSCWLWQVLKCRVGLCKGVGSRVEEHIEHISVLTTGQRKCLDPVLRRFIGHILLGPTWASKTHHGLVHCHIHSRTIEELEVHDESINEWLHFILPPWTISYVKHPEYLEKSVTCHHSPKEGNLRLPCRHPVAFQCGYVD